MGWGSSRWGTIRWGSGPTGGAVYYAEALLPATETLAADGDLAASGKAS